MSAVAAPVEAELTSPAVAKRSLLWQVLPWVVCLGLTLIAYGSSLRAGIMFDAALDLPRATDRGWLEVLTNAGASPYYRPLTLLIWKACHAILGRNDFVVLHGLSLASHAICGWLVYQLGRRLLDRPAGLAAAALFLLFPFSYQVVGFVDSLFHSLATLWLLAAAVLYWDARALGSHARMAAALACGALALLTHENAAALLTPAVVGLELLGRFALPVEERARSAAGARVRSFAWPLLLAGETAAFLGLWLAVPRWPSTPKLDLPSLKLNLGYFFQAIGFPFTMALGHLPRWGSDVLEAVVISAVVLLALLALSQARRRLAVAGFGLLWFAAALALPALLLPWPNYVIDAPRLLYGASVGIALLWAAALGSRRLLGVAAVVAVLAESLAFVAIRERLLDQGARVVRQLVDSATQPGPEAGRVYVNVPAFVGPTAPDFLLGHSGVTMLPDYFGLDLEVAAASGQRLPIQSISYDDLARPWTEAYGLQGKHGGLAEATAAVAKGGGVYVTRFDPGALRLEYEGRLAPPAAAPPIVRFGDWAALTQARANLDGRTLTIRLSWQALAPAPADFTVFVHVVADAPQPLAQLDGYPIAGLLPPRAWPPGSSIDDVRRVDLPPNATGQPLRVLVGLYDRAAPTTRAPAFDPAGQRLPNDAVAVPVGG